MTDFDVRDVKLPPSDLSILAGVRGENQREMLKSTMQSNAYKTVELIARADELERENKALRAKALEAERAIAEAAKDREKLRAAESARAAAERVAEREGFARIAAEGERDELLAALHAARSKPSRLDLLIENHAV